MAKQPPKNVKIKSSQNKASAVEGKGPSHNAALQYIDKMVQEAPGTRQEHITAQQCVLQLGRAIQDLTLLTELQKQIADLRSQVGIADRKIGKQKKQIEKLKGK